MKRHSAAGDHIDADFDLLKIIKKLRLHATSLKALLDKP